jgi:hypothetical protein
MTDSWSSNKHARLSSLPTRRRRAAAGIVRAFPFRPRFEFMEDRTLLSTFLVTTTADSGSGSLRQAIVDSNAATGATNTITFSIQGSGVQTIAPQSALPAITNPVLINGWSQPGFAGTPQIEINGSQAGNGDGLTITAPDVTVRGMDINGFSQGAGIHITRTNATGDWIYGNFLGTDPTGTQSEPNYAGVEIDASAAHNLIGTNGDGVNDTSERNLLSGNLFAGVLISGKGTDGNAIAGNFIGTSVTGGVALGNGDSPVHYSRPDSNSEITIAGGIVIDGGASGNRIGTDGNNVDDPGQRNIISGNNNDGIDIIDVGTEVGTIDVGTKGNVVAGNFIGTDVTGTMPLGNHGNGVYLGVFAQDNWVGANPAGGAAVGDEGNVISGNSGDGVQIDRDAAANVVAGDKIGTDAKGEVALGNSGDGVDVIDSSWNGDGVDVIDSSSNNTIGGTGAGSADVISGNGGPGIEFDGSGGNLVEGDFIGTDATGTKALGNAQHGVQVIGSAANTIGGTAAGAADVISGNGGSGVVLYVAPGNLVEGNFIGTDATGTIALGNSEDGVSIYNGLGNTIGGTGVGTANVISDNEESGVELDESSDILVEGDFITANGGAGVVVGDSLSDTSVGNQITANRIFGNTGQAIDLGNDGVTYNSTTPRQGPNDLQNFPFIFATAAGQLKGWLGGSTPDTLFHLDFFASSAYGPGGSGEAEDYLGSMEVTTDATGQASFAVPFSAPTGLPIITATATDLQGNTSEVSALRRAVLQAPTNPVLAPAGQSTVQSTSSGDGIAIQDPDAGPTVPSWELTLSVSAGTLALSSTAGLIGSGDGTGSLSYNGPLAAIDSALNGLRYAPPSGPHVFATLTLGAQSYGAPPLQSQFGITDGVFVVDTTADSGPGSLRQAILDANTVTALARTIDFAIPGAGLQTIELIAPLPPIKATVLIDGTTQPGFAGAPLIELGGGSARGPAGLTIAGSDVTVRGLAIDQFAFDTATDEFLVAQVHPQGLTTQLSLLDSQGRLLVQGDGLSPSDPDNLIAQQLVSGSYFLNVERTSGAGTYSLTTSVAPTTAPFQPLPVGRDPAAIAEGDFTDNGHVDLAVVNDEDPEFGSPTVSVLLGNGDGSFQPQVTYAVGSDPDAIVAGDFNGDGHTDLAVANDGSDTVSVLLGDGDGTFQPQVTYAVGPYPSSIVAGDFTGNGHVDLAVVNNNYSLAKSAGTVSVLLGNGDGTFQPQVTYAVGSDAAGAAPNTIVAGDFTGDGHTDLAVANGGSDTVSVLLGNGDGTFQPQVTYSVGAGLSAIVAGDFTGDGRIDLVVANGLGVSVLLGNGDGTFQPQVTYSVGAYPSAIVAGDFNGDGRLDLAVASDLDLTVSVLLGNGDGTFQLRVTEAVGSWPDAIVAGEFNGDGRTDLAVANAASNTVSVLLGNGDGTFQPQVTYAVGSGPTAIVAGDFNGDGRTDLAVANAGSNTVSVLLGNGDGTFQPQVTYAVGSDPSSIVAGDFTGDGHTDLAIVNNVTLANPQGTVSVLLGNGDGTFQPQVAYAVGSGELAEPSAIVAGDFNGDGRLDIAVVNSGFYKDPYSDGTVSVLLGNGDGTFQPQLTYAVGPSPYGIAAGDFTGDGRTDLAVYEESPNPQEFYNPGTLTYTSEVSVLLSNGDGTFQPAKTFSVGLYAGPIVAGDFTGDGRTDLAVANDGSNTVSVLLGNGDGTFQPQVTFAVGTQPEAIVTGDFTGDGHLDLAVANTVSSTVSVLLGNGDGTFVAPGPFATTPVATPRVADVNGDGTNDVLVVDGAGDILYRQAIPGQPGTFEPPVTVNPPLSDGANPYTSRDIAWIPNTIEGPLLASVDAQDDAISLYAYRDGGFVRIGSLTTGQLPAQIIAADLNGDGVDDLVVRNAGDGTVSVFAANNPTGLVRSQIDIPTFLPPATVPVGLGVSDVESVDTTGSGRLDLVVTNKLTGQLSILYNLGDGTFAPPVPYRAGTGLSAVDPGSTPEVSSQEATAGVAAGTFTAGGPTDLVTINPGSNTLDVLAGLGGGRFANPVTIETPSPAEIVRTGDFTGNGLDDIAVLTADGLSIYLANGQGGFFPTKTPIPVPSESDGLTTADLTGNGKLDLLVGDPYGDVLVLLGNGDGTFAPYHEANQAVELAVANLTGNGTKDIIYADQGLDRVVVDYGAGNSPPLADRSTGLLDPGAVALADLNGDGIPDLIVANSGSNNVLIYPGLGKGQFGPAVNDGNGYFVGTNPVGITVAYLTGALPDLVVADEGSDQVSILLNQGNFSFTPGPRLNSGGSGPVSTVVGNFTGGAYPDLLVTNSQSNDVALLKGRGQGFFDDQNPPTVPVGNDPVISFVGDVNGQADLVTVNAGSNDLSVISNLDSRSSVTTTISSGGLDPETAFAFSTSSGFDDLVVGNTGDGVLALFAGSASGLTLMSSETVANLPNPTGLAFSSLTGGQVQFYAATEGQEAATLVALSLGVGAFSPISAPASPASSGVAQLVSLQESSLALVGTLLTVTIEASAGQTEALSTSSVSLGQSVLGKGGFAGLGIDDDELEATEPAIDPAAGPVNPSAPAWQRYTLGTDEAIERFDREHPSISPGSTDDSPATNPDERQNEAGSAPAAGSDLGESENSNATTDLGTAAADIVIDLMCGPDRRTAGRRWWSEEAAAGTPFKLTTTDPSSIARARGSAVLRSLGAYSHASDPADEKRAIHHAVERDGGWAHPGRGPGEAADVPAFLVFTSLVAGYVYLGPPGQHTRSGNRGTGTRRRHRL